MGRKIVNHTDLDVYQKALAGAMMIFDLSRSFPREETYALTDQIRRSSRSVCANLAEAWRKRRYEKAFISKLSDAEGEAAETQVWLTFLVKCGYLERDQANAFYQNYREIIAMLVGMIHNAQIWTLRESDRRIQEEGELYGDPFE